MITATFQENRFSSAFIRPVGFVSNASREGALLGQLLQAFRFRPSSIECSNGDHRAATVVVPDIEQLPTSKFFFRIGAIVAL
jgi:hypothetical protein